VGSTAAEYLHETSLAMRDGYLADCVVLACRLAELLLAEGRSPWIGRIREVVKSADRVYHGPLIPRRFPNLTWTTHYICCCDGEVYDPIATIPIASDSYVVLMFGRPLAIETHLDPAATSRLVKSGEIRNSFRLT
jgi:hypothetical protein